jgi:Ca2+-binding EF-hand superfamily protein
MRFIVAIGIAAALGACSTVEREAGSDTARAFRALDRNGDGYISRDEALKSDAVMRAFDLADQNGDGKLDIQEFKSIPR